MPASSQHSPGKGVFHHNITSFPALKMIGWPEIYKVLVAMLPLYASLALGYGSVKWWHMFKPDQCDAINRFLCYFILPFFTFQFASLVDPYQMNFRFISADLISKIIIAVMLTLWANFSSKGSYAWSVTSYSLATLNNTLVVGVPLLTAMYGQMGADLVVQSSVIQSILWFTALLILLEVSHVRAGLCHGDRNSQICDSTETERDLENQNSTHVAESQRKSYWSLIKIIFIKVIRNPNSYACILGISWALLANRWHIQMPSIVEGSIDIMAKAGSGVSMFSMGLFMAMQEKVIACGPILTLLGMVLRFAVGPATMIIGSLAVGLHGNVLRVAIIQAALPEAVTAFVFAKEYGLHADVLSTAVIFGTVVSLPILIAYYAILEAIH